MLDFQFNFFFYFLENIELYAIILSIFSYLSLLSIFFIIFFFFNISKINTLLDLKFLNSLNFFSISIIFVFLSLAGIPPFLGFLSKFLLFISVFNKNQYFFIFLFTLINIFMIYFYIQNIRFLIQKVNLLGLAVLIYYNAFSYSNFNLFNFLNFFNIFSLFVLDNWILILGNLCAY